MKQTTTNRCEKGKGIIGLLFSERRLEAAVQREEAVAEGKKNSAFSERRPEATVAVEIFVTVVTCTY